MLIAIYIKIFPNDKIIQECFITNQMVFNKSILKELLNNIESQSGTDWITAISKRLMRQIKRIYLGLVSTNVCKLYT